LLDTKLLNCRIGIQTPLHKKKKGTNIFNILNFFVNKCVIECLEGRQNKCWMAQEIFAEREICLLELKKVVNYYDYTDDYIDAR
jgi:hypothetical protein